MNKSKYNRLVSLERERGRAFARKVCFLRRIKNPTDEQLEKIAEFAKPENLSNFILQGLQRRISEISKVDESR